MIVSSFFEWFDDDEFQPDVPMSSDYDDGIGYTNDEEALRGLFIHV